MGYDVVVAAVIVTAVLALRMTFRTIRAVRRQYRRATSVLGGVRRGEALVLDAGWWTNQRDRRRLWRSVHAADRAVTAAVAAGVPVGDLRSVARQLRAAAKHLDAGLASTVSTRQLQMQVRALVGAADAVTRAAVDAVATDSAPLIARAVDAARLELAALR